MAFSDFPPLQSFALLGGISFVLLYWILWRTPLHKLLYPPGPPERNLISGNISDLSASRPWLVWEEWGKKYGNVLHFRVFNKHTIILNSYEDCVELLEKRSNIYSDRPKIPILDLMGWTSFDAAFMPYGPQWRYHRRLFQQYFKSEKSVSYQPVQTKKVNDFLYGLLNTPEDFIKHYRTLSAAIIMSLVYDHDVAPKNDFFVEIVENALGRLSAAAIPGASLLNAFPILRFTPSWFPGANFKRKAIEARELNYQMRDLPLASVEARMKKERVDCLAADMLENCQSQDQYTEIASVIVTAYIGGAETTVSTTGTFFHAMALFPDIQAKAQQEIDSIIGSDHLISFDDRPSLPYSEALYRELHRWKPVAPVGIAHAASSDDVYKGYYIPKGATVIPNIWAITHDPIKYPNPDMFEPNRFLLKSGELNEKDDEVISTVFGFGRRICPGRHLASGTVWLAIATVLQNFMISKKRDSNGAEIPIIGEYTDGLVCHPQPFECSIAPRTSSASKIILGSVRTK